MKSVWGARCLAFSVVSVASLALLISICSAALADETGACCFPTTGECQVLTQSDCYSLFGIWLGPGINCNPNPCPNCLNALCEGACCLPDGSCAYGWKGACDEHNGTFIDGVSCQPNPCTTSSVPAPPKKNQNWGRIKSRYR